MKICPKPFFAVALLLLGMLSAAGGNLLASAHAQSGRLDQIRERGEVTLGYREASLPFSYLDDKQQPVGYSMDICHGIVDAVRTHLARPDLRVRYVPVTSSTRIPLVANGTVDMVCGSATNNAQRQQQVWFAPTTFVTAARFVSLKATQQPDLQSLKGKTVTSTAGSSPMLWLTQTNAQQNLGMRILPAKDHAEAFLSVERGRAAAFFMDDILLAGLVANARQPDAWQIGGQAHTVEPYGIILPKDDTAFKQVADTAVAAMMQDGRLQALYERWFTQPIPPRGINLNWPMTDTLKRIFARPTDSPDPLVYQ